MKCQSSGRGLLRVCAILLAMALAAQAHATAGRATAAGVVTDSAGKPVANATVLVHSAGVRTGYSIFCPTCYADCGKRAVTDSDGRFTLNALDDELIFDLLVIKDGYAPKWIRHVDPQTGPVPALAIDARTNVDDPQRGARGSVVDESGTPIPYALVQEEGAVFQQDGQWVTGWGSVPGTEALAVTNAKGEFEIVHGVPAKRLFVRVSARAKAPTLSSLDTGLVVRKAVSLHDGATIHGRLLNGGKPVPNVELGIMVLLRASGASYPEERVSTDAKGRFMFTNVPAGRVWDLYLKAESLGGRGVLPPTQFATERDGGDVNVGDLRLQAGVSLSGRVELSDGHAVPVGNRVLISAGLGANTQTVTVGENGTFVVHGLLPGGYLVAASVRGYHPVMGMFNEVLLKHDVSNYVLRMVPESPAN